MKYRAILGCAALLVCGWAADAHAQAPAQAPAPYPYPYSAPPVDYWGNMPPAQVPPFPNQAFNYYYPPEGATSIPARLYMSPRPVPPWVGYTYVTYQPFSAHELLYMHKRVYYRDHPDGGRTTTRITWR